MNTLKSILLATAILVTTTASHACSYALIPFCQSVEQLDDHVVLTGTVESSDSDGIDFRVRDVLRGSEDREVIRVWDGTDFDCNGPFSMAAADLGSVGSQLVLVLPIIDSLENTWDVLGDYRRPTYFGPTTRLEIVADVVTGYLNQSPSTGPGITPATVPYDEFVAAWMDDEVDCSDFSVSVQTLRQTTIQWHNNPVDQSLIIQFAPSDNSHKSIAIYNSGGILVHGCSVSGSQWSQNVGLLPTGMYIVTVTADGKLPYSTTVVKI